MKSRSLPTGAKYLIGEENGHIYNKFLPDPNSHCNMYFHHHAHLTPTAALQSKHAYKFPTLQMMEKKKKKDRESDLLQVQVSKRWTKT